MTSTGPCNIALTAGAAVFPAVVVPVLFAALPRSIFCLPVELLDAIIAFFVLTASHNEMRALAQALPAFAVRIRPLFMKRITVFVSPRGPSVRHVTTWFRDNAWCREIVLDVTVTERQPPRAVRRKSSRIVPARDILRLCALFPNAFRIRIDALDIAAPLAPIHITPSLFSPAQVLTVAHDNADALHRSIAAALPLFPSLDTLAIEGHADFPWNDPTPLQESFRPHTPRIASLTVGTCGFFKFRWTNALLRVVAATLTHLDIELLAIAAFHADATFTPECVDLSPLRSLASLSVSIPMHVDPSIYADNIHADSFTSMLLTAPASLTMLSISLHF